MGIMRVGLVALGLSVLAGAAHAGPIERACLSSAHAAGNQALCSCVQKVADITLSDADQRLAAQFFTNPDKAEQVRMQSSASANAFWQRYTIFGQQAEMACRG
jgi:hypothetical protein